MQKTRIVTESGFLDLDIMDVIRLSALYSYIWYFLIYSCLGWCAEVAFAAVKTGKFINRGFLNGPVCPIYGFGVCLVVFCLTPVADNILFLFLGSVVLTSAIEYFTGYVLEKVYHQHWWDYSKRPFNFRGYICLQFSLLWGVACVLILKLLHPAVYKLVAWIPGLLGATLVAALLSALVIDFAATVMDLQRFRRAMKMAAAVSARLRALSDDMGESISDGVITAVRKKEEFRVGLDAYRFEKNEKHLQDKADLLLELYTLIARSEVSRQRLMQAFPNLKRAGSYERLEELKHILRQRMLNRKKEEE